MARLESGERIREVEQAAEETATDETPRATTEAPDTMAQMLALLKIANATANRDVAAGVTSD